MLSYKYIIIVNERKLSKTDYMHHSQAIRNLDFNHTVQAKFKKKCKRKTLKARLNVKFINMRCMPLKHYRVPRIEWRF